MAPACTNLIECAIIGMFCSKELTRRKLNDSLVTTVASAINHKASISDIIFLNAFGTAFLEKTFEDTSVMSKNFISSFAFLLYRYYSRDHKVHLLLILDQDCFSLYSLL